MEKLTSRFEQVAVIALMVMLMLTIFFGTVVVAWKLFVDLTALHDFLADPKSLFDVFGLFVALLVGIELLMILRHFSVAHEVNTRLVVETALIALCNKIITISVSQAAWTTLLAVAAVTLALAVAIYALRETS